MFQIRFVFRLCISIWILSPLRQVFSRQRYTSFSFSSTIRTEVRYNLCRSVIEASKGLESNSECEVLPQIREIVQRNSALDGNAWCIHKPLGDNKINFSRIRRNRRCATSLKLRYRWPDFRMNDRTTDFFGIAE